MWENSLDRNNNQVNINLEFFERDGDVYYRTTENFSEKAYSLEEIEKLLSECGLEILAEYDDDSFNAPHEKSQRIVMVTRKI